MTSVPPHPVLKPVLTVAATALPPVATTAPRLAAEIALPSVVMAVRLLPVVASSAKVVVTPAVVLKAVHSVLLKALATVPLTVQQRPVAVTSSPAVQLALMPVALTHPVVVPATHAD